MFQFRLASVQRLRENSRDERRRALAEALEAEQVLIARRQEIEADLHNALAQRRQASGIGRINVDNLAHGRRYELMLKAMLRDLDEKLSMVRAEAERRRLALVDADQQARVIEKLAESQRAEYETRESKIEDREIDAAGLTGWVRQHREETR